MAGGQVVGGQPLEVAQRGPAQPEELARLSELAGGRGPIAIGYQAKGTEKGTWQCYRSELHTAMAERLEINAYLHGLLVDVGNRNVLTNPQDGDVGSIMGLGFAPQTGGAVSLIDQVGQGVDPPGHLGAEAVERPDHDQRHSVAGHRDLAAAPAVLP